MEAHKATKLVHLKGWALPAKDLRMLHFHRVQQTFSTDPKASDQAVPLFLGADVLAGSGIACDNQPRIHARYAKKGLATKLHFNDGVKLAGIHGTSKGVWFYTIQGVFRAVFELHDRQSQLECLTVLQELWRLRFGDDLLQESYNIKQDTEIEETGQTAARNQSQQVVSVEKQSLAMSAVPQSDFKKTAMAATSQQNTRPSCDLKGHEKEVPTDALKQITYPQLQTDQNKAEHDLSDSNDVESRNDNSFTDHNYSSSHPDDVLCQIIRILDNLAEKQQLDVFLRRCIELLTSLVSILKDTGSMGLPLDLLGCFVTNVRQMREDQLQDENHMRQTSMVIVSEWLGQQFQMSNKDIVGKVEDFKKRHIMCVDNLPPAEEIIDELFPPAMKTFFLTWMASSSSNKESVGGSDCLMFDSGQFPVLQLILEFANHTLISGVAHVLYSRLIHS
ncbi:uncharacterized protein [Branchiostoma lanceolatum]|uniref:uncharacterized protein isoform X2 n=1 Tax=Branchiostoma lanceolatum TaxID=7740 RepID=UPI003451E44B